MTDKEKHSEIQAETEEIQSGGNKLKDALIRQQGAFKGPMSFDDFEAMLDKLDEEKK